MKSSQDYYPFGMLMPNRNSNSNSYAFGMNGQLKDDEISNISGGDYSAEFWEYDPRIGRRWNIDPLAVEIPSWSPYSTFSDNPMIFSDPTGLAGEITIDQKNKTVTVTSKMILYGSKADKKLADKVAKDIENAWNTKDAKITIEGTEYKLKVSVQGEYMTGSEAEIKSNIESNTDIKNNYFRVEERSDIPDKGSYSDHGPVLWHYGSNSGMFKYNQIAFENTKTTGAHEWGHGLGLEHPYAGTKAEAQYEFDTFYGMKAGIMWPRGSACIKYCYPDNTLNPELRQLTSQDLSRLTDGINWNMTNGSLKLVFGHMTNKYHSPPPYK